VEKEKVTKHKHTPQATTGSNSSRSILVETIGEGTDSTNEGIEEVDTIENSKGSLDSISKPGTDADPDTGPENYDQKKELDAIGREARERKATKADDAAVPEELWEEHLLNDRPTPWNVCDDDRPTLRRAMNLMRARMLRWWKKKVTTSFLGWTHHQYKGLAAIGEEAPAATRHEHGNFSWKQAGSTAEYHDKYHWTPTGRVAYHSWWKRHYFLGGTNLEPGADAVV
jgi:hypothetical protein